MKKRWILMGVLVSFILSALIASGVLAAKDEIVLNASNGNVTFTHKKHNETRKIDCLKCHHTWKQGETSGKVCKECHKAEKEGNVPSAKDALHKDCRGCHDEAKKANKPAGPTVCNQCHIKGK